MEESKIVDINLKDVDWTNLDMIGFQRLSKNISEKNKLIKATQERKKRINVSEQVFQIKGVSFVLPSNLIIRLKALKSGKSRDKLIEEIFAKYTPIEVL